ncbi:50S ribosomal protein L19 [Bienertia sinuspersici]
MAEGVCLKFWHGGKFKTDKNNNLSYVGGEGKTFEVDPDQLCGFFITDLAKSCGQYADVEGVYYLMPGMSLLEGLVKVFDDDEVRKMLEVGMNNRSIELFVQHGVQAPILIEPQTYEPSPPHNPISLPKRPNKLTPKRLPAVQTRKSPRNKESVPDLSSQKQQLSHLDPTAHEVPHVFVRSDAHEKHTSIEAENIHLKASTTNITTTSVPEDYDWYDPRPPSPVPWQDLIGTDHSSDYGSGSDPEFEPESEPQHDSDDDGSTTDDLEEEVLVFGAEGETGSPIGEDTSDDEYHQAREKVKGFNEHVLSVVEKVQADARKDQRLRKEVLVVEDRSEDVQVEDGVCNSDCNESEDLDTPPESGDEVTAELRRSNRSLLIGPNTNFSSFKWKLGQRFTTRSDFKEAVAKYGILQGRNVGILISNKGRQQRLGVSCEKGCPFRLYASWDTRRASYVVKTVKGEHTCVRNMERTKQMKIGWMARQFLEVFKARPHWPAKEIIESIRLAYRVMVSRGFAYKVKYRAHKLLHGSMKDHYNKVGRYIQALKAASPGTDVHLVTFGKDSHSKPIFQRLYVCFDGVKKGWVQGCRRVICIDSCFLKTFLGGQLMSAVRRDGNDQMFPIAWAVVEGENNCSWTWFLTQLQSSLSLGQGEGLAIISDEHQVIYTPLL